MSDSPPVADSTPSAANDGGSLLDRLQDDLRSRWGQGSRVLVETYLEQYPELRADPEAVLDLIYHEVVLREERGEAPRLEEYLGRFPQYAAPLRCQFEVHQVIEAGPTPTRGDFGVPSADMPGPPGASGLPAIAGYEVLEELGCGGQGIVYRARQEGLNRLVALKILLAGAHARPENRARLRTEAAAVARLQHPNIVQIYEVGDQEGRPYLAMEYVEGGSLARRMARAPVPARRAADLVATLARAVQHAHQRHIIHRDLKPANVLLTEDGQPKITDFGLAKVLVGGDGPTQSGEILGTPSYMAPEQAEGKNREVSPAVDVYALGAILYELLTGRPPFLGATPLETLLQVQQMEAVPPARLQPKVPRDLETICLKCLQKQPAKRYADAAGLAEDLRRFLGGEPIRARRIGWWERGVKWVKRRPAAAVGAAVATAAVLSMVALGLVYNRQLNRALGDAEGQRQHARESLRRGAQAVKQSLIVLGDQNLRDIPRMEPKQLQTLTYAVHFFQEFLAAYPEDTEVRQWAGEAYLKIGQLYMDLGHDPDADDALGQVLAIQERLAADAPDRREYRHQLANTLHIISRLRRDQRRLSEAVAACDRAIVYHQGLVAEDSGTAAYRHDLARHYHHLGNLQSDLSQPEQAAAAYEKARELHQALADAYPQAAPYRRNLANHLHNLGHVRAAKRQYAEAESYYQAARELLQRLAATHPGEPIYRHDLARLHNSLATLLAKDNRPAPTILAVYDEAIRLQQQLAQDYPYVLKYRFELARQYRNRGNYCRSCQHWPEAEADFRRALDHLEQLMKSSPRPFFRGHLGITLSRLGLLLRARERPAEALDCYRQALLHLQEAAEQVPSDPGFPAAFREAARGAAELLVRRGEHAELGRLARTLTAPFPGSGTAPFRAAWLVAQAAGFAAGDRTAPEAKRREQVEAYTGLAAALLREALQKDCPGSESWKQESAFAPLGSSEAFRRLLIDVEDRAKNHAP
jgi:tetratricopeptide (TPR) repeat protein/predicted Ser/Thr protein kinase